MTKNELIARELLNIKARFHDSPTVGKLLAAWTTYLDEQYPSHPMNYDEMAGKIVEGIKTEFDPNVSLKFLIYHRRFKEFFAAKLEELYPVSKDLEAAVREGALRVVGDYRLKSYKAYDSDSSIVDLQDLIVQHVLSAVAPLLPERDNRIVVLETEVNDWESSNHERVIADQQDRIKKLEETCKCLYREAIEQWREDVKTGCYTVKLGDTKRRPFLMAVEGILALEPEPEPESSDED